MGRYVSGVIYDKRIAARMKGKVYRTVVRPAMIYSYILVVLAKRREAEPKVLELKMLRFSFPPGSDLVGED